MTPATHNPTPGPTQSEAQHRGASGRARHTRAHLAAHLATLLAVLATLLPCAPVCGETFEPDSPMYQDPALPEQRVTTVFSPRLLPLWLEALAGPEVDLRRSAARTIGHAHKAGLPITDETVVALRAALKDKSPLVRQAAAQALVDLDARSAGDALLELAKAEGYEVASIVEPALAQWKHEPAREEWIARVRNSDRSTPVLLKLAVQCLAVNGNKPIGDVLLVKALSPGESGVTDPSLRIELARAAAACGATAPADLLGVGGADPVAVMAKLMREASLIDRIVLVYVLPPETAVLQQAAVDREPAVAAVALRRLLKKDPLLIKPVQAHALASTDANVRQIAAEMVAAQASVEAVAALRPLLDDPHPAVRNYVRRSLLALAANASLSAAVKSAVEKALAEPGWRGLEQAARMAGELDHEPVGGRLVELLEHDRPEVYVASAWALRKLASAATVPGMFNKLDREVRAYLKNRPSNPAGVKPGLFPTPRDKQVAQIIQALWVMRHTPAEPLLRSFLTKGTFDVESRAAAVWALGHFHADDPTLDEKLVQALRGRLADTNPMNPEFDGVRRMSAISIGRMNSTGTVPTLRHYYQQEGGMTDVASACAWSIKKMTGEELPGPSPVVSEQSGFFLEPVE